MTTNALALMKGSRPTSLSEQARARLLETTKRMMGGSSGPRISIRGGRFRMIVGGEQVARRKEEWINLIIIDAGPINRQYFAGAYDPDKTESPVCWSVDAEKPAPLVAKPMAKRCEDCPMNVKGSGQGDSRACRYSQRLAVMLEGDDSHTVYAMTIPATSLFGGDGRGNHMPLQAYSKLLASSGAGATEVVTQVYFDEDSETPKLFWKPERWLDADEVDAVMDLLDTQEVKDAITLNVISRGAAPEAAGDEGEDEDEDEKPRTRRARKDDDKVEEPRVRKAKDDEDEVAPKATSLANVLSGWSADDD